ncbi:MAG: TetR/AcrR family transcriptional regulator [Myxococcales bacterium]|nr:TetR/AcrR family transcriptional regulator [Myxococcales bacterium]
MADGKGKSRKDLKRETREALIAAGIALFSEEGVDLPSLDAICARAGFTRGAFYVHFRDRDDFLLAVIDRVLLDFVESVVGTGEAPGGVTDVIGRFLGAAAAGTVPLMGRRGLVQQLMTRGAQRSDVMRARMRDLFELALSRLTVIAEGDQKAQRVGVAIAPELIAAWLLAGALGLTTLVDVGVELDLGAVEESAHRLLRIEDD